MQFSLNDYRNDLLFIPLGGSGEIGMNVNLYYHQGKWLMIDLGAGFAEDHLPGIDMIIPDLSFIAPYAKDLVGLVITHIHEDHLGAVQHVWDRIRCPVYATPLAAVFLRARLRDSVFGNDVVIHEIPCEAILQLHPFSLRMVGLTHSTPEMQAVVLETPYGHVVHTGDWKFDPQPLVGEVSNYAELEKIGEEGVLALVGDSTNIFTEGTSGSEGALRESLTSLIKECKNMVAVTTFASNIARIETVAKAAHAAGRKIVLVGRSLWRIVECAEEAGYLQDMPSFLTDKQASNYPREKLLILCTGCQGEPLAAAIKLAYHTHPTLSLLPEDTIIFSSKIIPGNDKRIFRLFNKLVEIGVNVITERDHFVHVSGHPARDEIAEMIRLVKPKVMIPVHGEKVHMHEHAKFARSLGVPNALEIENGDVIRLGPGEVKKVSKVHTGYFGLDGLTLRDPDSNVMKMRRRMQHSGIVQIVLITDQKGVLCANPIIVAPGLLDPMDDAVLLHELVDEIYAVIDQSIGRRSGNVAKSNSESNTERLVRSAVRRILKDQTGIQPVINIKVEVISSNNRQ